MSRYNFELDEHGDAYCDNFVFGEDILRLDYESTTLFTFKERFAHIFHAWVDLDEINEETGNPQGLYLFPHNTPDFESFIQRLIQHDYPHIHMPYPPDSDVSAYEQSMKLFGYTIEAIEVRVIEEAEDESIAEQAVANLDEEWRNFGKVWE